MKSAVLVSSLTALALLAACSKGTGPAAAGDAAPGLASAQATAASAAASAAEAPRKAPPKPPQGKVVIDKAVSKAYADGVRKGRAETLAKRYDAAVAAFDAALVALPGDARALSERGYARLLAGKYEAARADLRAAEGSTKDAKLLGQIHYNHGLVAEKLGRAEEAKASFARSQTLNPSKAAAAKLGAAPACGAVIALGGAQTFVAKDWLAVYETLRAAAPAPEDKDKLASEAAAKERLCTRAPEGHCADLLSFSPDGEGGTWSFHPVIKLAEGYLVAKDALSERYDLPCGGDEKLVVKESGGLRMLRFENATGMRIPVCEKPGGELGDCGPNDLPATSACGTAPPEIAVAIFDVAKKKLAATVRVGTDDGKKPPEITLEGRALRVAGAGCDVRTEL